MIPTTEIFVNTSVIEMFMREYRILVPFELSFVSMDPVSVLVRVCQTDFGFVSSWQVRVRLGFNSISSAQVLGLKPELLHP